MVGSGGLAGDYRSRALVFGPLALGNLATYTAGQPLPGRVGDRYGAYEVIAIVSAGADPVLSLPRSEWSTVGLLYDPDKFRDDGAYLLGDLDRVVRFMACKSRSFNDGVSQFDGGFVVTRKQCVHFLVAIPGGRTYHGMFPAAAPCTRAIFPGAPRSQPGVDVDSGMCRPAPPNRYLPRRVGCVTVLRADIEGNGRPDLVLLYSTLSHVPASQTETNPPPTLNGMYIASQALLKIVRPQAGTTSVPLRLGSASGRYSALPDAAVLAATHVNHLRGVELFLDIGGTSSGEDALAYGYYEARLVPAGVTLGYGGDSATKSGFDCLAGNPPKLIQRSFHLIGPTIYSWWTETDVTYAWHGPRLMKIAERTFRRRGLPPTRETGIGAGCIAGTG